MVKDSRTGNTYEIQVRRGRGLPFLQHATRHLVCWIRAAACTADPAPPWAKKRQAPGALTQHNHRVPQVADLGFIHATDIAKACPHFWRPVRWRALC